MPDAPPATPPPSLGPDVIGAIAAESNEELISGLEKAFRAKAAAEGEIVVRLGEIDRRQAFRDEGATSSETWAAERFGVSTPTARALTRVGAKAWDMPHLVGSLCAGDVSLDKVRTVAEVATPETERHLRDRAQQCTVRELADIARSTVKSDAATSASQSKSKSEYERRFLRFNDQFRTVVAQLPAECYAEARTALEAWAREVPTDGETPWDHRLCDGFSEMIRSTWASDSTSERATTVSPHMVVVHVPLDALVDDGVDPTELAGELEQDGLIDCETVQRIACDATIAVAVDDDVGHTMYEGRARRFPTDSQRREVMRRDRNCRFPGCTNVIFTNVHHIVPWEPGGPTDLDNLALLCLHHHHLVHSDGWTLNGNANAELHFAGPTGRDMASRPSPRWTSVTNGRRSGRSP
jgi:hypothetical protein